MAIREQMKAALVEATRARDRASMTTLRTLLGAIDNAEAVVPDPALPTPSEAPMGTLGYQDMPRRLLTEEDIRHLLSHEAEERRTSAANYEELGREEEARRLYAEVALIQRCLDEADATA